jgi:hypothetical protein
MEHMPDDALDPTGLPPREPLPEEAAADAGIDEAATSAVLAESEERVNDPAAGISEGSTDHEHRRSEETR